MSIINTELKPAGLSNLLYYTTKLNDNYKAINSSWYHFNRHGQMKTAFKVNAEFGLTLERTVNESRNEVRNYAGTSSKEITFSALADLLGSVNQNIQLYEENKSRYDSINYEEVADNFRKFWSDKIIEERGSIKAINSDPEISREVVAHTSQQSKVEIEKFKELEENADLYSQNWFSIIYNQSQKIKDFILQYSATPPVKNKNEHQLTKRDVLEQAHITNGGRLTREQINEVAVKHEFSPKAMRNLYNEIKDDLR